MVFVKFGLKEGRLRLCLGGPRDSAISVNVDGMLPPVNVAGEFGKTFPVGRDQQTTGYDPRFRVLYIAKTAKSSQPVEAVSGKPPIRHWGCLRRTAG